MLSLLADLILRYKQTSKQTMQQTIAHNTDMDIYNEVLANLMIVLD